MKLQNISKQLLYELIHGSPKMEAKGKHSILYKQNLFPLYLKRDNFLKLSC